MSTISRSVGVAARTKIGLFAPMIRIGANQAKRGTQQDALPRLGRRRLGDAGCIIRPPPEVEELFCRCDDHGG